MNDRVATLPLALGKLRLARLARWLVLIFCFVLPLLLRAYSLENPIALNRDESQFTVSARQVLDDPVVWRSIDMTTSGPLNAIVISWPKLVGAVPSILTSRLTGLLLQSLAVLGVAVLALRSGFGAAALAAIVTTLFFALTLRDEYIHYASEDFSVLLMTIFALLFASLRANPRSAARWLMCGLVASCLPLAKLQSSILCLLFHFACLARLGVDLKRRRAGWPPVVAYVLGSVVPVAALVAPLFLVGEQDAILKGYLGLGVDYVGRRSLNVLAGIWPYLAFMAGLAALALLRLRRIAERSKADWGLVAVGIALWPVCLLTSWFPGPAFAHYQIFTLIGLPLGIALVELGLAPATRPMFRLDRPLIAASVAVVILVVCWPMVRTWRWTAGRMIETEQAFAQWDPDGRARSLFDWAGVTPADRLLMWGWEPQLTAYAGLKSADRSAGGYYLASAVPKRDYYRARLWRDLQTQNPAIVMDTVRPGYFFFHNFAPLDHWPSMDEALDTFPELNAWVQARYERIDRSPNCAALYLRHDLAEAWRKAEIVLHSTAAPLVDGSITDSCQDWWTGSGPAALTLDRPEAVRELWVLPSWGGEVPSNSGHRAAGTTRVRVSFIGTDGKRTEQLVPLFDYPKWTVVPGPESEVARIEVESLEHVGAGPALSEVKAFRTTSAARTSWLARLAGVQWQ